MDRCVARSGPWPAAAWASWWRPSCCPCWWASASRARWPRCPPRSARSAGADRAAPGGPEGPQEVAAVARAFDEALQSAQSARAEAETANRAKDEFLALALPRAPHAAQRHPRLGAACSRTTTLDAGTHRARARRPSSATPRPGALDRGPARRLAHRHRQAAARRPPRRARRRWSSAALDSVRPAAEAKGIACRASIDPRRRGCSAIRTGCSRSSGTCSPTRSSSRRAGGA